MFASNNTLYQVLLGLSLGLIFGFALNLFSSELMIGGLVLVLLLFAVLKRPEIALLGILVATSSIVYEDQLPWISLGISLHLSDILLLGLIGIMVVRRLVEPDFKFVSTPIDLPLLLFFCITLLSTAIALYQGTVDAETTRRALRIFSYYLTFFVVTNLVKKRIQLDFLLGGIYILAFVVAAAIVLQFVLGSSVQLLPGRVETLATGSTLYQDITRVLPPGWSVVLVSFLVLFCSLAMERSTVKSWVKFMFLGLFGVALIFTFLRSYWAALCAIFVLMVYLLKGSERTKLVGYGFAALLIMIIFIGIVYSDPASRPARLIEATMHRFGSLFDSGTFQGEDGSLNWRLIENEYAVSAIAAHPWLGMGMGFTYRPWDARIDQVDFTGSSYDFRKHVHNGHLWIMLQSGLLGYISLIWLSIVFLVRGFQNWRFIRNIKFRSIVLGFVLTYLVVFIAAVANSSFTQWRWTPLLGIMIGINEVILKAEHDEAF